MELRDILPNNSTIAGYAQMLTSIYSIQQSLGLKNKLPPEQDLKLSIVNCQLSIFPPIFNCGSVHKKICLNKFVKPPIQHRVRIPRFISRPCIFHQFIRM